MNKSFLFLGLAILCEAFGSTMLKLSEGFSLLYPSIGVVVGYLASFTFLGLSLKSIPLSNAYAIWAGLGTAFTVAIGIVLFREDISFVKVLAVLFIIAGVVILNKSKDYSKQKSEEASIH
ncbi:multidrug efflux SMR transporter [Oceanobacillus sp. J11TS1]|uniref:DMT family transporter n=1 Tax=Oceanobacillus sp. J11TS1 TaxID=2807191 RepID=UPI001B1124A0|nr:multidrug efflux SMR transporter [Oceanobacillus sp. J11TS1]GIO25341.1 multidrug resistance protein EbrB [Oceanobacillus sp. J11TS1]